jgi:hypothetical protein
MKITDGRGVVVLLCALGILCAGETTSWGQLGSSSRLSDRTTSGLGKSRLSREEGAIYLEDILEKPIKLKVVRPTAVYLQLDGQRNVGTLIEGLDVELVALSDRAYKVRGRARHDQVSGWVRPFDLEGMTDGFKANLEKLYQRALLVEDLISKQQVALGMTMQEVGRALGEPTETASRLDKEGRKDTYAYVTYKRVPQYGPSVVGAGGQVYSSVTYVEVETGRVSISFENEMVTSIEESERKPAGSPVRIVPAPIVLF